MKRVLSIVLNVLLWCAIAAYFVVSSRYASSRQDALTCREVKVAVLDSTQRNFITPSMVKGWFAKENIALRNQEVRNINTRDIERFVLRRGFIKTARVYTTFDGVLHIDVTQRKPIMRINSYNGYNIYVTDDGYVLPLQKHGVVYVPVVTGNLTLPFERDFVGDLDEIKQNSAKKLPKNYLFFTNLINFVKFVSEDNFWNAFIVQINVVENGVDGAYAPRVEIVPRAGDHVVMLGGLEDYQLKLSKLLAFYEKGAAYEGWDRYGYLNLEYDGQVICTQPRKEQAAK